MCMVWGKKAGKWVLYPIIGILICSVWKVSIKYATSPIQIYTTINPNVEGESAQEMYAFLRMNTAQDDWVAYESSFLQYFGRDIQSSCQRQLVCRVSVSWFLSSIPSWGDQIEPEPFSTSIL